MCPLYSILSLIRHLIAASNVCETRQLPGCASNLGYAMKKQLKKITCRMIRRSDAAAVAELHSDAFSRSSAEEFESRVRNRKEKAMVAEKKDGTIIGYVLFDIEHKPGVGRVMYVANVGVSEKHRSRGVCGAMLPWLVKRVRKYDCEYAYLVVFKDNESAKRCYERAGFVPEDSSGMIRMEYHPPKKSSRKKKD